MVTRSRFPFLAVLLCLAAGHAAAAQNGSPEAEVRAAMSGFMDALNALDADRMATFFAPDITAFVPVAQAERVEGKDAVVRIFRAFVERTRPVTSRLSLVPEDLKVELSGPLAVVTFNVRDTSAGLVRRRTFVWRRVEDRWLISHFHASDLAPPRP
jgi:ketosteroid isomerase-like protein